MKSVSVEIDWTRVTLTREILVEDRFLIAVRVLLGSVQGYLIFKYNICFNLRNSNPVIGVLDSLTSYSSRLLRLYLWMLL